MTDDLNQPALRQRAIGAAAGRAPFDLLLSGARIAHVQTGEILEADVGICGPLIAATGPRGSLGSATREIDLSGTILTPGLIDTHLHIESSMMTPAAYAEAVLPRGVTTLVWDPHELGNVLGTAGVRWAVDAARGLPMNILIQAPSCVPSAPGLEVAGADFTADALAEILAWPEIIGLAELMDMRAVLDQTPRMQAILEAARASGKPIFGHARELADRDLMAYAAAGVVTDHELVSPEDLLAKLRAGFGVEMRGSHDYLLPGFVKALNTLPHLPPTLTLCTDDTFADDLVRDGGLDDVVRRLVRYGMPAMDALQAATLNAALRFGRRDLGLVAPGYRADIVAFRDLEGFEAALVLSSGQLVGERGKVTVDLPAPPPMPALDAMQVPPLSAGDFAIGAEGSGPTRLRAIGGARFTHWDETPARIRDGRAALPEGTLTMTVIHRHGRATPQPRSAALIDWTGWNGALASSFSHDSHNLTVFGSDAEAMALAANRVIAEGGGLAVAQGGKVLADMPLPLAGLLSAGGAETVAADFARFRAATDRIAAWKPPFQTFKACFGASLVCNPGPVVTDQGIADGSDGSLTQSLEILP